MEEKLNDHLEAMNREQSIYNGSEPASPIENNTVYRTGLTKRETMAMHILPAYITQGYPTKDAVLMAVDCADELLNELRKNKAK